LFYGLKLRYFVMTDLNRLSFYSGARSRIAMLLPGNTARYAKLIDKGLPQVGV
jgi:L-fucose mutarotase/ribose pyranase (RbsD/FucU family)